MFMVYVIVRYPGAMSGNMVCVATSSLVDISIGHIATKSHVGFMVLLKMGAEFIYMSYVTNKESCRYLLNVHLKPCWYLCARLPWETMLVSVASTAPQRPC